MFSSSGTRSRGAWPSTEPARFRLIESRDDALSRGHWRAAAQSRSVFFSFVVVVAAPDLQLGASQSARRAALAAGDCVVQFSWRAIFRLRRVRQRTGWPPFVWRASKPDDNDNNKRQLDEEQTQFARAFLSFAHSLNHCKPAVRCDLLTNSCRDNYNTKSILSLLSAGWRQQIE